MKRNAIFAFITIVFMACQESLEDRCARECKAYTEKKCPARIGDNTMIDSLVFNKDTHTLSYHYTLSGNADSKEQVMALDAKDLLTKQLRNDHFQPKHIKMPDTASDTFTIQRKTRGNSCRSDYQGKRLQNRLGMHTLSPHKKK